jgi:hypothetical protein
VKLLGSVKDNRRLTLRYPIAVRETRFRTSNSPFPRTITRVTASMKGDGEASNLYEVTYDLGAASPAEPVTLEIEGHIPISSLAPKRNQGQGRLGFETEFRSDLVSMWLLFPAAHPYSSYQLVRYPVDRRTAPEIMQSRYTIDHPHGSLIGWSVINPELDTVYECRSVW